MVVTRTFSDGRTDDRTMAAGASVTWTHYSVLFEVTWGKTRCVRAVLTIMYFDFVVVLQSTTKLF
jgi:hypothetical protein